MKHYEPQEFDIPELTGISKKQIDEHLKLYQGYVKHVNAISEQVKAWIAEGRDKNDYVIHELWRRLGFEFGGMRSHEYYFGALVGGTNEFDTESKLGKALVAQYGSYEAWKEVIMSVGSTRSSGWAIMYYDPKVDSFIIGWVDEHHLGHLSSLPVVFALDCWEHAYMVDYLPSERKTYIEAYLAHINWETVNKWFENSIQSK